ncbi:MAG: aminotransferase class V-fold PLP-dependent enzyme [Deltaproteobacteria bacterium]|nr:aminotransferase class V-fold PLP-dependent enzyme [Deltaproteobacteria bacterium]
MASLIYLDNNATTKPAPEVLAAVQICGEECWGNPSSLHLAGRKASEAIDRARAQAAALIHAVRPGEIAFTSGGTEGNNTAVRGILAARQGKRHIVTSAVEHSSVLHCCRALEKEGYRVTVLPVLRTGALDMQCLADALDDETAVVSLMWANNETGTIFPIERIAALCRQRGIPLHTDAVQAAGKIPIDVQAVPVDCLTVSGHKFHATKGVGFLYLRRGTPFRPLIVGGGQEGGRRAGTENVPQIVGLGVACELALRCVSGPNAAMQTAALRRDRFERELRARVTGMHVNGDPAARVPNTTNVSIEEVDGEAMVLQFSDAGVCCSTGSACSSGSMEPSHVLTAMQLPPPLLRGILRFSFSRYTTDTEIDRALDIIPQIVDRLRVLQPKSAKFSL